MTTAKNSENGLQSNSNLKSWTLSVYHEKSRFNHTMLPEIIRANEGMIFGILKADDGSVWFGTLNGVSRYDGDTITDFKGKEVQE